MNNASKDDELPFLELNEEIPAPWAFAPSSSSSSSSVSPQASQHPLPAVSQDVPPMQVSGERARYGLTPISKALLTLGAVVVLLMITFRVPPGLVLLGVFSVLRVLFFPLAILGFVIWAWRYRR